MEQPEDPILALVAREAPILVIDALNLEIYDRGRRRCSLSLEAIESVEREIWFGHVRINGEEIPALSRLPWAEWRWIADLAEDRVAQRRAALIGQGHDLAAPPPGLAEVQAMRGRPPQRAPAPEASRRREEGGIHPLPLPGARRR